MGDRLVSMVDKSPARLASFMGDIQTVARGQGALYLLAISTMVGVDDVVCLCGWMCLSLWL